MDGSDGMTNFLIWLFAIALPIVGIYLIKLSGDMNRSGKVSDFLVTPEMMRRVRHEDRYASFLAGRLKILAAACIVSGAYFVADRIVNCLMILDVIVLVAFIGSFLWFSREVRDGASRF